MIELENVTMELTTGPLKSLVLQNLSAKLPTNDRIVILGGPQSGKSTLINLLAGLSFPTQGKITRHARVSFPVGFQGAYRGNISVRENIAYVARMYGADVNDVVNFVVQTADVGRFLKHKFSTLPAHLRTRMVYALSYAIPFETYLIDNRPGAGDDDFRAKCEEMLELRAKQSGFILATARPTLAKKLANRVGILHRRRLKLYDDVDEAIEIFKSLPKNLAAEAAYGESPDEWVEAASEKLRSKAASAPVEPGILAQIAIRNTIQKDFVKVLADNEILTGKIAEIGGPQKSFADNLPAYDFEFLTLHRDVGDLRVRPADISFCPQIPDSTFDAIVSVNAMERVARPIEAAREMMRILKPNGIIYHATPFSYPYRGAPTDFWRLTPEAFKSMFAPLVCLKAEFSSIDRLRDGPNAGTPDDSRENMFTIYAGRKSPEALKEFKARQSQQLVIDLVAMLIEQGAEKEDAFALAASLSARIYIDANGDPRRSPRKSRVELKPDHVRKLWRNKRKLGLLATPNRFSLGKIVAELFPQVRKA